jgi:WD40 repeat protein
MFSTADWSSLQFNESGNQILVGTEKGMSIVLDGFEGAVQRVFTGTSQRPAVSCITSDDKTLLMGNDDGSVTGWSLESGTMLKRLEGHTGPVKSIASNPKYAQFASCCKQTALWVW